MKIELVTPKMHELVILYIDYYGNLRIEEFKVECFINVAGDVTDLWESLCKKFSDITMIHGLSNVKTLSDTTIETDKFRINYDSSKLKTYIPMSGYLGSVKDVILHSLQMTMCSMMSAVGNGYSNCYVRPVQVESENTLNFTIFDEDGVHLRIGKLEWEFENTRSESCASCMEGFSKFKEILATLNNTPIVKQGKFNYSGDLIIDLNTTDDNTISNEIYTTFYPVISAAKISKLKYTSRVL